MANIILNLTNAVENVDFICEFESISFYINTMTMQTRNIKQLLSCLCLKRLMWALAGLVYYYIRNVIFSFLIRILMNLSPYALL